MPIHFTRTAKKDLKIFIKRVSTPCSLRTFASSQGFCQQEKLFSWNLTRIRVEKRMGDCRHYMPFARPSSLLFLRYASPVNCESLGWPSLVLGMCLVIGILCITRLAQAGTVAVQRVTYMGAAQNDSPECTLYLSHFCTNDEAQSNGTVQYCTSPPRVTSLYCRLCDVLA